MTDSPLLSPVLFHVGPVAVETQVVTAAAVSCALGLGAWAATRNLSAREPSRLQTALELLVTTLDAEIRAVFRADPAPYRALIGTLLLFILAANWSGLIPGVEPPTGHLETPAALAGIVTGATIGLGIRSRGILGWLKRFAEPSVAMVPLNLVEQVTRALSLTIRLFGNVMSGVFVIGIVGSLAALLVPIPLMALDLLTGAVQAYIFAILAAVFIAAAVGGEGGGDGAKPSSRKDPAP